LQFGVGRRFGLDVARNGVLLLVEAVKTGVPLLLLLFGLVVVVVAPVGGVRLAVQVLPWLVWTGRDLGATSSSSYSFGKSYQSHAEHFP